MDDGFNDSRTSVFEHHRGLLFSIAYRMLGSVADAEDALQDAFISWQRASETDVRSAKAFLVTIATGKRRANPISSWKPRPRRGDSGLEETT